MKKIFLLIILFSLNVFGQSGSFLRQRCTSPYNSIYSTVQITSVGNINYIPCPTRSSIFDGIVNFTNATVIGLPFTASPLTTKGDLWGFSIVNTRVPVGTNGQVLTADSTNARGVTWTTPSSSGVTGSGTINFIPRFTVTGSVIGNTPFSWSGSQYVWNNTALNAAFRMELTPFVGGSGLFRVGDFTGVNPFISIAEGTGRTDFNTFGASNANMRLDDMAGTFDVKIGSGNSSNISLQSGLSSVTSSNLILLNSGGGTQIGDVLGVNNNTLINLDDGIQDISLTAGATINADSKGGVFSAGDVNGVGNSTTLVINDIAQSITLRRNTIFDSLNPFGVTYLGATKILSTSVLNDGQLLIGATGTVPSAANLTAGSGINITNGAGSISIASTLSQGSILAIPFANSTLANATGTVFASPCSTLALTSTTEGNVSCPVTRSGTIRNLFVRTGGTAKVNTPVTTITMRKNGSNQTVTLTLTETVNTTSSDTTHSFTVAAGDLITISVSVAGAAAVSTSVAGITFEID